MEIIIAGDLVPTKSNEEYFAKGEINKIIDAKILELWDKCDYRMFNLETPLYNCKNLNEKILKAGPNLIAQEESIIGIKNLSPNLITLANNHIMDYGEQGLYKTCDILEKNNIEYIGVGKDIKSLKKYSIIQDNNTKIGIYACCEREFSIATHNKCGANPFDEYEFLKDIKDIKENADKIVILYHGGKEHYRYPSPDLQKRCRFMADLGVDLIVCQHSHCIGAYEKYNNTTIVYGQGNFVFDANNNEFWNTALLINWDVENNEAKFIPIIKENNGFIRLASESEKKDIMTLLNARNEKIQDKKFIEEEYRKYAKKYINIYLKHFYNRKRIFKFISKVYFKIFRKELIEKAYTANDYTYILNFIECEAHRELLIAGLKERIEKDEGKN